jgi:hypothetical protein
VDTAGITVIKHKEGLFVSLCHLCDKFGVIEVRHVSIVPDYARIIWLKPKDKTA